MTQKQGDTPMISPGFKAAALEVAKLARIPDDRREAFGNALWQLTQQLGRYEGRAVERGDKSLPQIYSGDIAQALRKIAATAKSLANLLDLNPEPGRLGEKPPPPDDKLEPGEREKAAKALIAYQRATAKENKAAHVRMNAVILLGKVYTKQDSLIAHLGSGPINSLAAQARG